MGNHDVTCWGISDPLWADVQYHRTEERRAWRTRPDRFTFWGGATRQRYTWDAPGLAYWLVQCVPESRRPALGAIAEALWRDT
jgi:hypothetical protein